MAILSTRSDPAIAGLMIEADRARARGANDRAIALVREAARVLSESGRTDDAIDLCVAERDYPAAAEIAERARDWRRAAKLWFRGGDFLRAARARFEAGEILLAAELYESGADFATASQLYERAEDFIRAAQNCERAGDKKRAADLLVRAISTRARGRVVGVEADEACRRAGVLYADCGHLDMAVRVLKFGGQNVFAGKLLARAGHTEEAIKLLTENGDFLAAAELARASGSEQRARALLGERAEKEGKYAEAAVYFEQAELFARAARLHEYANDHVSAAQAYDRGGQWDLAAELYQHLGRFSDAIRCLLAAGKKDEAEALEDRSEYRSEQIRAHVVAGDFLRAAEGALALARTRDRSRFAEAAMFLARIPPDHPEWLRARMLLAEVLAEDNDNKSAIGTLGAALNGITLEPKHVAAVYQYARHLESEGFLAQARQAYRTAFALDPTFRDITERMTLLGDSEILTSRSPLPRAQSASRARATSQVNVPVAPMMTGKPIVTEPITPPHTKVDAGELLDAAQASEGDARMKRDTSIRATAMVGVVLRGRFRIERRIGRGAQAEVYLAKDLVLDRAVAIKVLSESLAVEKTALERFLREARLAARVHHASCLSIFDFGQERGVTFMAMEYFNGRTLREYIKEESFDLISTLNIARDIADALQAVHTAGIIHRDVKPSNVMVDDQARSRLADFGVATDAIEEPASGVMVGTMKYMAPEQARGHEVDRRADIFSFGVMLFEMLSGKAPFGGSLDALIKRVKDQAPDNELDPALPEHVRSIVVRAMAHRREDRYPDAAALVADLQKAIEFERATKPDLSAAVQAVLSRAKPAAVDQAISPAMEMPPIRTVDLLNSDEVEA